MIIPGKSHSRVESCNSWVLIETLNFPRVCTFYWCDRSWIATGAWRRGRSPAVPNAVPGRCQDPIDIVGGGTPKTAGEGAKVGALPGKRNGRSAPGWWIMPGPVRCSWTTGRCRRLDGCAKLQAVAASLALWRTCQNADVECSGGRNRRPASRCCVRETTGTPSGGRNICRRCPLPLRYATVLCLAASSMRATAVVKQTSDRLIAGTQRQVAIIPLRVGLLSGGR